MPSLFIYDGRTFPDPDARLSVEDVRRQLADYFPELANADIAKELGKRGYQVTSENATLENLGA